MLAFVLQHHPHRALAHLRRELVRRQTCHGSILVGVGASGKPGVVHAIIMPCVKPFRDMKTASLDGTVVEVRHGPDQVTVLAWWNDRLQGWIEEGDETRKVLHRVTGWQPAGKRGAPPA